MCRMWAAGRREGGCQQGRHKLATSSSVGLFRGHQACVCVSVCASLCGVRAPCGSCRGRHACLSMYACLVCVCVCMSVVCAAPTHLAAVAEVVGPVQARGGLGRVGAGLDLRGPKRWRVRQSGQRLLISLVWVRSLWQAPCACAFHVCVRICVTCGDPKRRCGRGDRGWHHLFGLGLDLQAVPAVPYLRRRHARNQRDDANPV